MTSRDELANEYFVWLTVEKGRGRATIEAYRRDLRGFFAWLDDRGTSFDDLRGDDVDAYLGDLFDRGRAPTTVARALASLRGWFSFLMDEGHLEVDPTRHVRPTHRGRHLPRPLDEAETIRLLDSIPEVTALDRRDRALLELLYGTGCRVSEAVGVRLEDLDFDEELIKVTGKGDKQRLVPMGGALHRALRAYVGPQGRSALLRVPSSALLLNARGTPLSRQGVDGIIAKRALNVGIERSRISAHVFRHSCATHMLAHGADIRVVQELLGHASIATTQLYTAVSVSSLQRAYQGAHPRAQG